jgi:hypothetical protein
MLFENVCIELIKRNKHLFETAKLISKKHIDIRKFKELNPEAVKSLKKLER